MSQGDSKGGSCASKRRSGIGKDARQPVMAFKLGNVGNAEVKETIWVKRK